MHLHTQWYKIQNTKNLPQRYKYSSNNAISSLKQAKYCNICPLENFKNSNVIMFLSDSLPVCQPVNRNWPRAYTIKYIAFKLPENKRYFRRHEPLLFRWQYLLCAMAYLLFIHSNWLIFLLEINVVTFNYGINIPYKVLKLSSKQLW